VWWLIQKYIWYISTGNPLDYRGDLVSHPGIFLSFLLASHEGRFVYVMLSIAVWICRSSNVTQHTC